ncbi:hypothetical protein Salat_1420000 [Sesamum alatum]|uniref:Uncharacterized protein n=1 Tax=Sesamum alatum TaxID=300844 RepID=A0AAE2CLP0_9LAMI|nr:hypothetical protein Salat_1420000 [Sesamum alatum]
MLERPSKNTYLDEDHWKQILSDVTGEDVVWRPYERLQQEQSEMLSLEPQRIFFTTSVLFYYQLINYQMPESTSRQLWIHRPFIVPKRYFNLWELPFQIIAPYPLVDSNYSPPAPYPLVDPNYPSGASNDGSDTPHDRPDVQDDGPNAPSEDAPLDDHPNDIADLSRTGLNDTLGFDLPHNSNNDRGTSSAGSYDNSNGSAPALRRSEKQRYPVMHWSPDVEWRPYERLQQEESQMLSLEPQRIFFTTSVLFDYQLINYHMPESAPRQLWIHRPFTVPKRCRQKLKAKDFDGPNVLDDGPNAPSEDAPLDDHPNDIVDPSCTGLNDTLDFDLPHNSNNDLGTSSAGLYDNSDSSAPALRI